MTRPDACDAGFFSFGQEKIRTPSVGRFFFCFLRLVRGSAISELRYENVRPRLSSGDLCTTSRGLCLWRTVFAHSTPWRGGGDKNIITDTIGFCARRTRRVSYTNEAEIVNDERFAVVNHRRRIGRDSAGNGFESAHTRPTNERTDVIIFLGLYTLNTFGQSFPDAQRDVTV